MWTKTIYLGRSTHSEPIWTQLRFSGHFCLPFQSSHRSSARWTWWTHQATSQVGSQAPPLPRRSSSTLMKTTSRVSADPHPHGPGGPRSGGEATTMVADFSIGPAGNCPLDFPAIFDYQRVFRYWRDIPWFFTTYHRYWHVTVGKNFGCHAVHEKQRFVGLPEWHRGLIRLMGINRIHWVIIDKRRSVHSVLDPQVMVYKQGGTKLTKLLLVAIWTTILCGNSPKFRGLLIRGWHDWSNWPFWAESNFRCVVRSHISIRSWCSGWWLQHFGTERKLHKRNSNQRFENKADMPWSTSQLAHRLGHRTHCMSPGTQGEPSSDWNRRTTLRKSIHEHLDIEIKSLGGSWKDPQPMAFRLLSGEPVACEAEIGKLALVIGVASCYIYVLSWNRADAPYAVTAPPQSNSECTIPVKEIESTANVCSKWGARNLSKPCFPTSLPKYPEAQKMVKKPCFHRVSRSASAPSDRPKELWHAGGCRGGSRRPGTTFVLGIGTRAACFMGCPTGGADKSANRFMAFFNCGKPHSVSHPQDSQ